MEMYTCAYCEEAKPLSSYYLVDGKRYGRYCKACRALFRADPSLKPKQPTLEERFWSKVYRRGDVECWPWLAGGTRGGYGTFQVGGRSGKRTTAHRIAYELTHGSIPDGYEIDHLCRNVGCVNPAHLEAVTPLVNKQRTAGIPQKPRRRKTHCKNGHEFTPENTSYSKEGWQLCRECHRLRQGGLPERERAYVPKPRKK